MQSKKWITDIHFSFLIVSENGTLKSTFHFAPTMKSEWLLALPAQYAEQGLCNGRASVRPSVRLSVCLSVPAIDHCNSVRRVCCCGPGGQEISIDRGGRRFPQHETHRTLLQRSAATAGSATLSAAVGGWPQTCLLWDIMTEWPLHRLHYWQAYKYQSSPKENLIGLTAVVKKIPHHTSLNSVNAPID